MTNGGSLIFGRKGRLTFLPLNLHVKDHYLEKNYLKDVNNISGVVVTMDTLIEKAVNVILRDRKLFKFNEFGLGLYYYGMESTDV